MDLSTLIQLGLTAGQFGLTIFNHKKNEESYVDSVEAVIEAGKINADRVLQEGRIEEYKYRYKAKQNEGVLMASMAARGGNITGSNMDVFAMEEANNKFNIDLIKYKVGLESRNTLIDTRNAVTGLRTQAANQRISTVNQLVNIATTAYGRFNELRQQKNRNDILVYNRKEESKKILNLYGDETNTLYNIGVGN